MSLTEHPHQHAFAIQEASDTFLKINGEVYSHSLILTVELKLIEWDVKRFEDIQPKQLEQLLVGNPDVVLIGTGAQQHFLPATLLQVFYKARIGVEAMNTPAAARTYNILAAEERRVAAGFVVAE